MSKQFWAIVALIIVVFVGIVVFTGDKSNAPGKSSADKKTLTQHLQGQGQAKVTLTEYGDYQCPYCGQYYPLVKQVQQQFDKEIYFQFRNFPLTNAHPNAFAAARAAEAAALQNKFWEMHDLLYESQQQWSQMSDAIPAFEGYAKQLGLNMTKYKADFASSKVNNLINADLAEGTKLGITGTPTFFLDGKKLDPSPQDVAAFEKIIKAAIAKKTSASSTQPTPSLEPAPSPEAVPAN